MFKEIVKFVSMIVDCDIDVGIMPAEQSSSDFESEAQQLSQVKNNPGTEQTHTINASHVFQINTPHIPIILVQAEDHILVCLLPNT